MKKTILKVGLLIMALTTMITMNACSQVNNDTANRVCEKLYEKYGETFVVSKIGGRLNSDSAKLYVHPADNEELVFVAKINNDDGKVEDEYIEEKINYQIEKVIKESFSNIGIEVDARCLVVTQEPLDILLGDYTPLSFKEKYCFDHYSVYLIIKDKEGLINCIIPTIKTINEIINVKILISGYIFEEGVYEECAKQIKDNPEMNITMIEKFEPVSAFDIMVDLGECSVSESELSNMIWGP